MADTFDSEIVAFHLPYLTNVCNPVMWSRGLLNKKVPTKSGRFLMGTFFIWFFTIQGQGKKVNCTRGYYHNSNIYNRCHCAR